MKVTEMPIMYGEVKAPLYRVYKPLKHSSKLKFEPDLKTQNFNKFTASIMDFIM